MLVEVLMQAPTFRLPQILFIWQQNTKYSEKGFWPINMNKIIRRSLLIIKMEIVRLNINIPLRLLLLFGGSVLLITTARVPSVVCIATAPRAMTLLVIRVVSRPSSRCNSKISEANHCKRKRT